MCSLLECFNKAVKVAESLREANKLMNNGRELDLEDGVQKDLSLLQQLVKLEPKHNKAITEVKVSETTNPVSQSRRRLINWT